MWSDDDMHAVLITGAAGNLGRKLVVAFADASWCTRIVAADRPDAIGAIPRVNGKVVPLAVDLTSASVAELREALSGVDTLVHFAVVNSMPSASWPEAATSLGLSSKLVMAARDAGLQRFIFASSNHAVGSLKDGEPLAARTLTADRVAPGTTWETPGGTGIGIAYGASKAFTERICEAAASRDGLSTVCIRIGWCQAGDNHPRTLNAGGDPSLPVDPEPSPTVARDLGWFRSMWLSNRDFVALFERAVLADDRTWPGPAIVVNGMSDNAGMPWDIETTRRLLGYEPQDDVFRHV